MEAISQFKETKGMNVIIQATDEQLETMISNAVQKAVASLEPAETAEPRLISTEKTMELVDVSRTTLFHWNRKGILKPVKIGRTVKYRYNDVMDFINKGDRK